MKIAGNIFGSWINNPFNRQGKKFVIITISLLCGICFGAVLLMGVKSVPFVLASIVVLYFAIDCLLYELLGSIVFTFLVLQFGVDAAALLGIWFDSSKVYQFVTLIIDMGFLKSIMIVFYPVVYEYPNRKYQTIPQ